MNNEEYQSILPGFEQLFAQKIASKTSESQSKNGFDPYKMMVNKKKLDDGEVVDTTPVQQWPEKDVKTLEDFCKKMGIMGFNCGRMHPILALRMLKDQLGYVDGELDERVLPGYEKIGTHSSYGPNYPYSEAVKKQILHG
jgi:hypothetical protein